MRVKDSIIKKGVTGSRTNFKIRKHKKESYC
mgnify:CR=1 FL=1